MLVGYARCSTDRQDLRVQKKQLRELGVDEPRIYVDRGYTGRNKHRPGLQQALAACRSGDTLVVTKLDRLGRSISDVAGIADRLTDEGITLKMGKTTYDPEDPFGKMFFNLTATFAEFEADLISQRTKEGLAIAREQGKLTGRKTRLTAFQQQHAQELLGSGDWSQADVAKMLNMSPSWLSRLAKRWRAAGLLDQPLPMTLPTPATEDAVTDSE
jgi:DNA invertase Pin-like site-specific DNA recombinase